jgi:hypothetical protein
MRQRFSKRRLRIVPDFGEGATYLRHTGTELAELGGFSLVTVREYELHKHDPLPSDVLRLVRALKQTLTTLLQCS